MKWPLYKRVMRDRKGATMMEFGLISPVVMVMLLGTFDAGHTMYMRSVIDGAMQTVARDSALEGAAVVAQQQIVDAKVTDLVQTVSTAAVVTTTRGYYKTFSEASKAQPEEIINDQATLGFCEPGEHFMDANENHKWDANGAADGQGGAKDVVVITVKVDYPRLFPLAGLVGLAENVHLEANTVLANQPYGEQDQYGAPVNRTCT